MRMVGTVVFIGVIILVSFAVMGTQPPIHEVEFERGPKADRLPVEPLVAKAVEVVRIIERPPPPDAPPVAPKESELLEVNQPKDTLGPPRHDPCARSGGHKVVTHGGKHWHCRY